MFLHLRLLSEYDVRCNVILDLIFYKLRSVLLLPDQFRECLTFYIKEQPTYNH